MRKIFLIATLFCLVLVSVAQARHFVWTDEEFRFKVMYPDSWRQVTGFSDYERIRVIPPGDGKPHCVFTAKQDRRFIIYPKRYYEDVLFQEIQWPHWDKITAQLEDRFFYYFKEAGVSHGDARTAIVDYTIEPEDENGTPEYRRAMVYTGLYHDVNFIALCEVEEKEWLTHLQPFNDFVGSIHFEPRYHPTFNAYYRDFLDEQDKSARKDDRSWLVRQLNKLGLAPDRKPIPMERQHRSEY